MRPRFHAALPPCLTAASFSLLFAPWVSSGQTTRSAYGFVRAVLASGFELPGWAHMLMLSVISLPAVAATACAAALLRLPRVAFFGAAIAGAVTLMAAGAGFLVTQTTGRPAPFGPWAGAMLGLATVAVAVLSLKKGRTSNA